MPPRANTVRGLHALESATARLDRDELEQALRESGAVSGSGALAAVDARPIGIGAMADTFLVRLRWHGEVVGPDSLVAKLPSVDPAAARTAASLGAYEREARFYAELAPRTGLSLPAYYGTLGGAGLLLEDLSGLEPGDQFADMPPKPPAAGAPAARRAASAVLGRPARPPRWTGCTAARACRSRGSSSGWSAPGRSPPSA